jgi:hypothetical protein
MSLDEPTDEGTIPHFRAHGWMRVRAAFSSGEAAAMRAAVWRALADVGINRDDPATWTTERPEHLQHLKEDPVFQAVGSARLLEAIDAALEARFTRGRSTGARVSSLSPPAMAGVSLLAAGIATRTT